MNEMLDSSLLLFCSIISENEGSKAMHLANEMGAYATNVLLGKGIISGGLLNFLGITSSRKEILWAIVPTAEQRAFLDRFLAVFRYDKPNHGIAFSIPLTYFYRAADGFQWSAPEKEGVNELTYDSIYVVVNKGSIDQVIEAAEAAGSTGGTVLHGRGTGKAEKVKLFGLDIEPEKEILMILAQHEKTKAIVDSIVNQLNINERGQGILFVAEVKDAVGLYRGE